jgi:hypothetical protein
MFDRALEQWVEAAKVPGNVWLGTGVPQSGSTAPELHADPSNFGWHVLGEHYAWMDRWHSFRRVKKSDVRISSALNQKIQY